MALFHKRRHNIMDMGTKIRTLRRDRQWTQPQLADVLGVEQSYLSKLENGKSIPSADTFDLLLESFQTDTEAFLAGIDNSFIYDKLGHIPQVASYLIQHKRTKLHQHKNWLLTSAALCVLGVALGTAGAFGWIFPTTAYTYKSYGVVRQGEPKEIFDYYLRISYSGNSPVQAKVNEIKSRIDEAYKVLPTYHGKTFVESVEGGHRAYQLREERSIARRENRYLMLIAVLLFTSGAFGFGLERRLSHVDRKLG